MRSVYQIWSFYRIKDIYHIVTKTFLFSFYGILKDNKYVYTTIWALFDLMTSHDLESMKPKDERPSSIKTVSRKKKQ